MIERGVRSDFFLAGTSARARQPFIVASSAKDERPPSAGADARAQAIQLGTINVQSKPARRRPVRAATRRSAPAAAPLVTTNAGGDIGYHAKQHVDARPRPTRRCATFRRPITVITKQQIQDIGAQRIEDVVRYVPGVNWHQGEGNRDQIVIRGQSSTADFFVNGMRDDAQIYRDLYNTERLEFLKGPNAMIFGRGGGGGMLNRVLKEADGVPINEWKVQTGSYNNARVSADVGGKISDNLYGRINGVFEDTDSYRDYVHMQRGGVNPTLTWLATPLTKVKLSYEYFHDERTADRGIPSFNRPPYARSDPQPVLRQSGLEQHAGDAEHRNGGGRARFQQRPDRQEPDPVCRLQAVLSERLSGQRGFGCGHLYAVGLQQSQ